MPLGNGVAMQALAMKASTAFAPEPYESMTQAMRLCCHWRHDLIAALLRGGDGKTGPTDEEIVGIRHVLATVVSGMCLHRNRSERWLAYYFVAARSFLCEAS